MDGDLTVCQVHKIETDINRKAEKNEYSRDVGSVKGKGFKR